MNLDEKDEIVSVIVELFDEPIAFIGYLNKELSNDRFICLGIPRVVKYKRDVKHEEIQTAVDKFLIPYSAKGDAFFLAQNKVLYYGAPVKEVQEEYEKHVKELIEKDSQ